MEAAFHGVPTVGVPFQFEQAANGQSLVDLGMGEMCRQAVAYRTGRNVGVRFERKSLRDLIKQVGTGRSGLQGRQGAWLSTRGGRVGDKGLWVPFVRKSPPKSFPQACQSSLFVKCGSAVN
jgi:hypothetical protein